MSSKIDPELQSLIRWRGSRYFGVTFEQGRNEMPIDEAFLGKLVTENKDVTGRCQSAT